MPANRRTCKVRVIDRALLEGNRVSDVYGSDPPRNDSGYGPGDVTKPILEISTFPRLLTQKKRLPDANLVDVGDLRDGEQQVSRIRQALTHTIQSVSKYNRHLHDDPTWFLSRSPRSKSGQRPFRWRVCLRRERLCLRGLALSICW